MCYRHRRNGVAPHRRRLALPPVHVVFQFRPVDGEESSNGPDFQTGLV
jgi:hypothetical protein